MADFKVRKVMTYQLRCGAMWDDDGSGCSGTGPRGFSEIEACDLAAEDGWRIIKSEDCWACPVHVQAKEKGLT